MFEILRSKGCISRENIVYLQKIALHVKKPHLYVKAMEYTNDAVNDILHFRKNVITFGQGVFSAISKRSYLPNNYDLLFRLI